MKASIAKQQAANNGVESEQRAREYLISQGLQFVAQNYRVSLGEIDLIFQEKNQLVFVEVKYRQNLHYGCAAAQFTAHKRRKVVNAIKCYLREHNLNIHHTSLRIDLVTFDGDKMQWLKNV